MARQPRVSPAWQNLANLLIQRRVQLNPSYRTRRVFCEEKKIDYRVISDIESARRDNFSGPMIAAIEIAYDIAEGSIEMALKDPNLKELPPRTDARSSAA